MEILPTRSKISELAEELKKDEFKRNLFSAQVGLAARPPNPAQAVWTMEKIVNLLKVLMSGDLNALQRELTNAVQPAQGAPVTQFTDAQNLIDVKTPELAELSALTGDVIEDAFKEIYGELDETGQRSTTGPISQRSLEELEQRYRTEDGSVHPAVAFFKAQHESGKSLEQVLERVLENNEKLKAYIEKQGLSAEQVKALKESMTKAVLGSEKGVRDWKDADGKPLLLWTTAIDKKAAGEWVARDFGVAQNDPAPRFAIDPGVVQNVFNQSIKGRGINQIPEVFSQAFADSSGLELDDPQGAEIAEAVRKITEDTMMEVRSYTESGRLQGMHEPLVKGKLPPDLKEYAGVNQQALLGHLVAQRVEQAIRANPAWRAAVTGEPAGPASGLPLSRAGLFNDSLFDRGVAVAASKVEMDPASHALKLSGSDGNTALYIKADQDLGLLKPVKGADGAIGFNSTPISPEALKTALENHTRQGGTIEMRMVALQDGDLERADVVGVQLVLKDEAGKDVGSTMIGMGGDGGIEMEKSKEQLQAMAQGINEPGADNKPKPGVTYAPGLSVVPGMALGVIS